MAAELSRKGAPRFCVSKTENCRLRRRMFLAWTRLPQHSPGRPSRILDEKAGTEHKS